MSHKNINNAAVLSSLSDGDYLHITSGSAHERALVSKLVDKAKALALTELEADLLDKLTDGCFIMYHSGSAAYAAKASEWTGLQTNGKVADGVLLVQGKRRLVVAPTESPTRLYWSSQDKLVAPSGDYSADWIWAMNHFDGKNRTAAILADATIGGDGSGYAPGYCASYSRGGLGAGKWWLPSLGELMMILANQEKINACLELIDGAQQIAKGYHFSSSEYDRDHAWVLLFNSIRVDANNKVKNQYDVRPVSDFYS